MSSRGRRLERQRKYEQAVTVERYEGRAPYDNLKEHVLELVESGELDRTLECVYLPEEDSTSLLKPWTPPACLTEKAADAVHDMTVTFAQLEELGIRVGFCSETAKINDCRTGRKIGETEELIGSLCDGGLAIRMRVPKSDALGSRSMACAIVGGRLLRAC